MKHSQSQEKLSQIQIYYQDIENKRLFQKAKQKQKLLQVYDSSSRYYFGDKDVKYASLNPYIQGMTKQKHTSTGQRENGSLPMISQSKYNKKNYTQLDDAPVKKIILKGIEMIQIKDDEKKKEKLKNEIVQNINITSLSAKAPYHPYVKEETMNNLMKNFPGALFSTDVFTQINNTLLQLGCSPDNTLFASSVCVDEINHMDTSLNNRLRHYWGECFYMGGLGGIPFIGKVGFGAFSHHVPHGGNLFILFAPHVGITPDGTIGKYARDGQDHHDSACGAAIGALGKLKENPPTEGDDKIDLNNCDPHDYQFSFIQQALKKHYHKIVKQENQMTALAFAMYEIVHEFVKNIIKTMPDVKLIIAGGIQINMKKPIEDMFLPLVFEIFEHNKPVKDLSKMFLSDSKSINTKI